MTYSEALDYIHSVSWKGSRPGLSRIEELCHRIGDPQDRIKFIHVAGTNGKGSICAMLSSVLTQAGYRTGMYTSPFILRFNERMQIDGTDISDSELAEITEYVRPHADAMTDMPTEFELITAIAFEYFARHRCDIVVLEVGMGGRLDSTNIISPASVAVSVITGIAMDHVAFLGDTPEKIAAEKAGIIKTGIPVVFGGAHIGGDTNGNAFAKVPAIIASVAMQRGARYIRTDFNLLSVEHSDLSGSTFSFGAMHDLFVPLPGLYQPYNAATALTVLKVLQQEGYSLSASVIREGLATVRWPGRFEILCRDPLVISDGGHNPEGIDATVASVKAYMKGKKIYLLSGVMADKNYTYMVHRMCTIASRVFTVRPNNVRALSADDYARAFVAEGIPAEGYATVVDAVSAAMTACRETNTPLLCLGSLYMYSEVRKAVLAEA